PPRRPRLQIPRALGQPAQPPDLLDAARAGRAHRRAPHHLSGCGPGLPMRAFAVTLSLAYLLLAHAATLTGLHWPRLAAVAVLCVLLLALLHGRVLLQLLLGCALAGCLLMAPQPLQMIMYATPVLVP